MRKVRIGGKMFFLSNFSVILLCGIISKPPLRAILDVLILWDFDHENVIDQIG